MSETVACAVCGEQVEVDVEQAVVQTRQPMFGPELGRGTILEQGRVVHECEAGRY